LKAVANDGKVWRQSTVVIDEENILEMLCRITSNELGDNLGADWRPYVVHSVGLADILSIIKRLRRVSVGYDKDVLRWKDLDGCFEGWPNDVGGFVAGDEQRRLANRLISPCGPFNGRRVRFEEDK
jgi:hypothetical protein